MRLTIETWYGACPCGALSMFRELPAHACCWQCGARLVPKQETAATRDVVVK